MTPTYIPVFVLPNVPIAAPIGCEIAALAPAHDPRIVALKKAHPAFANFLRRFSDNFGAKFEPTVLLVRNDAPPAFRDIAALASFRDLIALSTITHARALELRQRRGHRVLFGEAFAIYPWMLDRDYDDMIGHTPAILGSHEVDSFRGQSSPALFRTLLGANDIDEPLLAALMARWERHYSAAVPDWADVALMRSLNMAYHATLLPAGSDVTLYDVGRIVSLWISAFEILVHPGPGGQANIAKVHELLENTPWVIPSSGTAMHETGRQKIKRPLASWLYQVLYDCRNDFLHGNPVDRTALILPIAQRSVFEFAAPLYRLGLTSFLPLVYAPPMPAMDDPATLGVWIAERMSFEDPQKTAEKALAVAVSPPSQPKPHVRTMRPGFNP